MKNRFWGSIIALIFGALSILGGFSKLVAKNSDGGDSVIAGLVMFLGALAYRSAKKRRLNLKVDKMQTRNIERAELLIALLLIILQNNLLDRMYMNPVVNLVIPVWVLTAYVIVSKKRTIKTAHREPIPVE